MTQAAESNAETRYKPYVSSLQRIGCRAGRIGEKSFELEWHRVDPMDGSFMGMSDDAGVMIQRRGGSHEEPREGVTNGLETDCARLVAVL